MAFLRFNRSLLGYAMNIFEELVKILLGVSITGIVGAIVWLFKWVDRVDLTLNNMARDISHSKTDNKALSAHVAQLDKKSDNTINSFRRVIYSVEGRISRIETRVYIVENRLSDGLTQAIADRLNSQSLEVREIHLKRQNDSSKGLFPKQ